MSVLNRAIGASLERIDGPLKATGAARYAYEYPTENVAYGYLVQSTIAKGRIATFDLAAARALPGVVEIMTHENAPELKKGEDPSLAVMQADDVAFYGQIVAVVIAQTFEVARHAAALCVVNYREEAHDVELRADRPDLYKPKKVNANFPTDSSEGDPDAALASATTTIDATYTTPFEHNNPMEPHATIATWTGDGVLMYDANQGSHGIAADVASAFGLKPDDVRVIAPYVGGGFGSKAFTHPHVIATVMAAKLVDRPVKVTLTRQQMFSLVGYRTPTIQRVRLGSERDGTLAATVHDVVELTSTIEEFAEQTAVATRSMYVSPARRTSHRLAKLDVPTPSIMRAPGETPGMFALESAMDEMALACGLDPVEFRIKNEPPLDPETGNPFSSRNLVACLRRGAERFGWASRAPGIRMRTEGRTLVGFGVASSTYPARRRPSSARVRVEAGGDYMVSLDASDIGTGTWTALTQIAADALEVPVERVRMRIGDSALPKAPGAGGSMGIASWGSAIYEAAGELRKALEKHGGRVPAEGLEAEGSAEANPEAKKFAMHAYGAQFVEVRVDMDTGEVRVPRMCGVFAAGRIVNPRTARSQFIGGMTMGLSMALHEETVMDARFGNFVNHDFAEYHIAANADIESIDVSWIDEIDEHVNAFGAKGVGELGIVGTAAAIANAVHHATGIRIRDLPIRPDKLLV
ncbi:MAG: xanthine dehydrogenase family protein molybdopterin-binding subunit [Candidatus Eremiobacteraeota bacterium]|nr:xanthine dehydrogenase family protein molybdopterin-binding subunit [Candidatus Eremiobacteraeota bacterium]